MARKRCTKIGGQAVMEGVMMRGERSVATAVRDGDGKIVVESKRLKNTTPWWKKVPVLRGAVNFFLMLVEGMRILMRSAEVYGEEEPTEFEKKLAKKLKINLFDVVIFVALILGVGLSLFLFIMLPQFILSGVQAIFSWYPSAIISNLIMGLLRMAIFLVYIMLSSKVKDVRRVFEYHGAEHKVITCYEENQPLTVENVKKMSKEHDRCGTTFMFIVMAVSIIFYTVLGAFGIDGDMWARIGIRIILLPIVAGISYELLKFLAKFDNAFIRILKAPGLFLQKFTTREPSDDMIEVSIKAFETVMAMDSDESIPEVSFNIEKSYSLYRIDAVNKLSRIKGANAEAEADWIISDVLGISRSELKLVTKISEENIKRIEDIIKRRLNGEPLQYIFGMQEFYGAQIKCDKRALIPRFETEYLVDVVVKELNENKKVLDLCTGTGAIAVSIAKKVGAKVSASDISGEALSLAKENAVLNGVDVEFIHSDLFYEITDKFDMIVSNPPYISEKEMKKLSADVKAEPKVALFGGRDGLDFYRRIIANAPKHLNKDGRIYFEVGKHQAEQVGLMLEESFKAIEILKDLDGVERIVRATVR
ncbi:MAG: peptide chain release factor N(5)-glutamine methyltransferase [Clostridia bacterium]|nr:peptide chain release factor N(5)-glutamine methyltransferase [Clostridia bacterium]